MPDMASILPHLLQEICAFIHFLLLARAAAAAAASAITFYNFFKFVNRWLWWWLVLWIPCPGPLLPFCAKDKKYSSVFPVTCESVVGLWWFWLSWAPCVLLRQCISVCVCWWESSNVLKITNLSFVILFSCRCCRYSENQELVRPSMQVLYCYCCHSFSLHIGTFALVKQQAAIALDVVYGFNNLSAETLMYLCLPGISLSFWNFYSAAQMSICLMLFFFFF